MARWRLLSAAMVLTLVLAGCGGAAKQAAPTPGATDTAPKTTSEPTAPTKQTMTVKVGSTEKAALKNLPMFLSGIAQQENLVVEYVEFKGGSEVAKALLNGEIDFAFVAVNQILQDKSGELRLLTMVTNGPGQALLVDSKHKDTIKSVKDLAGKKVGVSSLGSGPDKTLRTLLQANGVDPKNVQILPVGLNANEVLGTDQVVAMITIEPFITLAIQSGKGTLLVDARKPEGIKAIYGATEVPWIALATRTGTIEQKPEAVQRMVSMVSKSLQFIASSPAEEVSKQSPAFFKSEVNGDEKLFASLIQENKATFSVDGRFNKQLLDGEWVKLQQSGAVPKDRPFPFEELVLVKFLDLMAK